MHTPEYVQQFDSTPQFWQFIRGLRHDDLIVELIQNDLDASATRTSISFTPDRLICHGNGEPVSDDGWRRLSYVMGAGDQVERKQYRIGVKNHGLKACFRLGDEIILRSNGQRMIQTLYKDGYHNHPSPGTLPQPVPDTSALSIGCSVEVPYRKRELVVDKGEPLTLGIPDEGFIESLFRDALQFLPQRLMGVVRPKIRNHYTLCLSHHEIGSVKLRWRAKRGRYLNGRGRRQFFVFSRICTTFSSECALHTTIHERACTFRLPFPTGKRPEIPEFFARDKRSFLAEIAWLTDKSGRPKSTIGVRRYPIAYSATSDSALTGVGVHFSAPFVSDAERHGTSQSESVNDYIDNACKDALVEILAAYLIHRHGPKAMQLYMSSLDNPDHDSLNDLIKRTLDRRALPLTDRTKRVAKRSRRHPLGPRGRTTTGLQRVVLPMFTWDRQRLSPLLSEICPSNEDQVDRAIPSPILRQLGENVYKPNDGFDGRVITFDENDALDRLQPEIEAQHFSWSDKSEWQAALGNPSVAKVYLDVALEAIQKRVVQSEQQLVSNTFISDQSGLALPLADMFSGLNLPPNLGQQCSVPIIHQGLQDHRILKRAAWKPKPFTLEEYVDKSQLGAASLAERKSFWLWLRDNWRNVNKQSLIRISNFPVWPGSNDQLLPLNILCEPRNTRVASILGGAIVRPSLDLLRSGIVGRSGRGKLAFRIMPTIQEFKDFLSERIGRLTRGQALTANQRVAFQKFERDLTTLVVSIPRLRDHLAELSEDFSVALDKNGNLQSPGYLVRDEGSIRRFHLLNEYIIDRPKGKLDQIDGWRPKASPSTDQLAQTLREDGAHHRAHIARLQEYVRQAKREGISPQGLIDVTCIPVNGELRSPSQIALKGRRDFWGTWKIDIPVTGVNPEVQRLYKAVGVVGGEPDSSSSGDFFRWLAFQPPDTVAKHADQVLRHINHKSGPRTWSDERPEVPFILVESDGGGVRLVTKAEATKRRSKVVIPDFEQLAEAIRQRNGKRPVEMAIVESRRVTVPIGARLTEFGLRTLSEYVGEPVQVMGAGISKTTGNFDFRRVLESLLSGQKGRQLSKRLAKLDLDAPQNALRSNWRKRLSSVQDLQIAESVTATYKLGRLRIPVPVHGKLDRESGTLWVRSDYDLQEVFFDVIADHIFEQPQKYYGSVLVRAYNMDMRERYPLESAVDFQILREIEIDEITNQEVEDRGPTATQGVHPVPESDPSRNIPNPGPIPRGDGAIRSVNRNKRGARRPQSAHEKSQIDDLKENQYAWHCQACLAGTEPQMLAPSSSYVEVSENRRLIMQAHHCDHASAGGARHAGNILLLCHLHHLSIGDAVTRTDVTRAFNLGVDRILTFNSDGALSNSLRGKVVTTHPPQREHPVSLFFTKEHEEYWLKKAKKEGLI